MRRIDLTGQRFGRLTCLSIHHVSPRGALLWTCECDCGNITVVTSSNLRGGYTQSCGCIWRERITKHGHTTHESASRTYSTWRNMLSRTTNPDHERWADWGGRGITVCERWREFENFLADMGERPPGKTIDRLDNDGNYEPGNCRWATRSEQQLNKRASRLTKE